ncbi:YbjP/YqhG family protein [Devosia sp. BK]|uniref:DUF3828 domain-containing protein n=1 Tax=Devosia sp. BK TaxID=2871706 RepID=UPI00293AA0CC|nr:DUF3828 domain-containing protein [Devosia sp. BK]MDV3250367.1 YbjP/YqhG family protein [Devosia sp. BK]
MRRLLALSGLFLALVAPAAAQPFDTPEALLEAFYAPYLTDDFPENEESFRSAALNALYEADAESTPEGEMGALDFDPYIDGQDYQIANLEIGEPVYGGDTATVVVSFTNFDEPVEITYDLVNENGGWVIDDLEGQNGEFAYRLSEIFAAAQE